MSEPIAATTFDIGEGRVIDLGTIRMVFKATADDTGGAYTLAEYIGAPGSGSQLHTHHNEDETFYILEGTMTFQLGEEVFKAGPGAYVNIPRGLRHAFLNEESEQVKAILIFAPAGLEGFFQEIVDLSVVGGGPSAEAVAELNQRYGLEFA